MFLDNSSGTSAVVALFTVSNDSIKTAYIPKDATNRVQRKVPGLKHLRTYPAVLLGRLGVNLPYRGRGLMIGRQVLNYIKLWFLDEDNKTGCRFLVVDAYNKTDVLEFYRRNGFKFLYASEAVEREAAYASSGEIRTRLMFLDLLHTTIAQGRMVPNSAR